MLVISLSLVRQYHSHSLPLHAEMCTRNLNAIACWDYIPCNFTVKWKFNTNFKNTLPTHIHHFTYIRSFLKVLHFSLRCPEFNYACLTELNYIIKNKYFKNLTSIIFMLKYRKQIHNNSSNQGILKVHYLGVF